MITSVQQWVWFLQGSEALLGLPLIIGGVLLLLGGWRLWKVCVVVTFAMIGGAIGIKFGHDTGTRVMYGLVGAALVGAASYPPMNYSVAVLGGLIGAGIIHAVLTAMWLKGLALWIPVALAFGMLAALSYINLRQVIVIVTSFQGAVLIVSGVVAVLADYPQIYNFFRSISRDYWFFLPFLLLVPTAVGCMLQTADARRKESGMVSGR